VWGGGKRNVVAITLASEGSVRSTGQFSVTSNRGDRDRDHRNSAPCMDISVSWNTRAIAAKLTVSQTSVHRIVWVEA
jgi:hypothetical protein